MDIHLVYILSGLAVVAFLLSMGFRLNRRQEDDILRKL